MQIFLVNLVILWVSEDFFMGAWKAFRFNSANINILVSLGIGFAYLYSLFSTVCQRFLES